MFGLRIRIICGCLSAFMGVSSVSLSALNGGVSGIVVSGCTLIYVKIFDCLSHNRPDYGWCAYGNYSVSSGLEDA